MSDRTREPLIAGDEVIVPSFTFPATVQVLDWLGLVPVFCEIDPLSHSLDPAAVASLIGPRTRAILGVHLWGTPCRIEDLQEVADRHELILVFDAAHAFGCRYRGRPIGGFGLAEMLSFHATKFVHSLEGGAIVTNSASLAQELRRLRNFGYENGQVTGIGLNAKMHEVSAAVGLHNLKAIEQLIEENRSRYQAYRQGLSELPGLRLYPLGEQQNYQYVVLEILPAFGLGRDSLWRLLQAEGILARRYFDPACHQLPPYAAAGPTLPVTEALASRVLVLPTGSQLSLEHVAAICELIGFCQDRAEGLARRLA